MYQVYRYIIRPWPNSKKKNTPSFVHHAVACSHKHTHKQRVRKCSYAAVKIALAPEWLAVLRFPVVLIRRSEEFTILYSLYMWRYYKGQRKGIWEGLLLSDTPYLPQFNPWPFWHPPTASFTRAPGMTLLPGSGGSTSREGPVMAQCKCYSKFFFPPLRACQSFQFIFTAQSSVSVHGRASLYLVLCRS